MDAWKDKVTIAGFDSEVGTFSERDKSKRILEVIVGTWIYDNENQHNCVGLQWVGLKGSYPAQPIVLTDNIALNLLEMLLTSGAYYDKKRPVITKAFKAIKGRLTK